MVMRQRPEAAKSLGTKLSKRARKLEDEFEEKTAWQGRLDGDSTKDQDEYDYEAMSLSTYVMTKSTHR